MNVGAAVKLIPGFLSLTYIRNTGAAFGIFSNQTPVLTLISVVFVLFVIYYYVNMKNWVRAHNYAPLRSISLAIILGGALGNLFDRVFRGYVIDYIDVRYFSVFNFADIMINAGVGLILLTAILRYRNRGEILTPPR